MAKHDLSGIFPEENSHNWVAETPRCDWLPVLFAGPSLRLEGQQDGYQELILRKRHWENDDDDDDDAAAADDDDDDDDDCYDDDVVPVSETDISKTRA